MWVGMKFENLRADFDLMYGCVETKCGCPLGVATQRIVVLFARSATTRGPHLVSTRRDELPWDALRRCSSLVWARQTALLTPSTASQGSSSPPHIKSKSALGFFQRGLMQRIRKIPGEPVWIHRFRRGHCIELRHFILAQSYVRCS